MCTTCKVHMCVCVNVNTVTVSASAYTCTIMYSTYDIWFSRLTLLNHNTKRRCYCCLRANFANVENTLHPVYSMNRSVHCLRLRRHHHSIRQFSHHDNILRRSSWRTEGLKTITNKEDHSLSHHHASVLSLFACNLCTLRVHVTSGIRYESHRPTLSITTILSFDPSPLIC